METMTLRRAPGRTGGLRSARKALWLSIFRAREVLVAANEPTVILSACEVLTHSVKEYMAIMREIDHPDVS